VCVRRLDDRACRFAAHEDPLHVRSETRLESKLVFTVCSIDDKEDLHRLPGNQPPRSAGRAGRRRARDLQVRLISAKPYADRLFQYHELGRLPDAAARAALVEPAATLGSSPRRMRRDRWCASRLAT
jgi:hypothetical protein